MRTVLTDPRVAGLEEVHVEIFYSGFFLDDRVVLFVDEADAFLRKRSEVGMSGPTLRTWLMPSPSPNPNH